MELYDVALRLITVILEYNIQYDNPNLTDKFDMSVLIYSMRGAYHVINVCYILLFITTYRLIAEEW